MILEHKLAVPADPVKVWDMVMDIPLIASCVPGVESVQELQNDVYAGVMKVTVGAFRFSFHGKVTVTERDPTAQRATLEASGADRRVGGAVRANVALEVRPAPGTGSTLVINTDAAVLGKLGELGQAVIRKKADQVMEQFTVNLASRLSGGSAVAAPLPSPLLPANAHRSWVFRIWSWFRRLVTTP